MDYTKVNYDSNLDLLFLDAAKSYFKKQKLDENYNNLANDLLNILIHFNKQAKFDIYTFNCYQVVAIKEYIKNTTKINQKETNIQHLIFLLFYFYNRLFSFKLLKIDEISALKENLNNGIDEIIIFARLLRAFNINSLSLNESIYDFKENLSKEDLLLEDYYNAIINLYYYLDEEDIFKVISLYEKDITLKMIHNSLKKKYESRNEIKKYYVRKNKNNKYRVINVHNLLLKRENLELRQIKLLQKDSPFYLYLPLIKEEFLKYKSSSFIIKDAIEATNKFIRLNNLKYDTTYLNRSEFFQNLILRMQTEKYINFDFTYKVFNKFDSYYVPYLKYLFNNIRLFKNKGYKESELDLLEEIKLNFNKEENFIKIYNKMNKYEITISEVKNLIANISFLKKEEKDLFFKYLEFSFIFLEEEKLIES